MKGHPSPRHALVFTLLLLTLAAGVLLSGCKPPDNKPTSDPGVEVTMRLAMNPRVGNVPVIVEVTEDGAPVLGAEVELQGDMTHAGMKPVVTKASGSDFGQGHYVANDFAFDMPGDWLISTKVKTPSGKRGYAELLTSVPSR